MKVDFAPQDTQTPTQGVIFNPLVGVFYGFLNTVSTGKLICLLV